MKLFLLFIGLFSSNAFANFQIEESCIDAGDRFGFQLVFDVKYQSGKLTKQAYQVNCKIAEKACDGILIFLRDSKLSYLDIINMSGTRVTSVKDSVIEISWGPLRKLYYDNAKREVTFKETALNSSGSATRKCPRFN